MCGVWRVACVRVRLSVQALRWNQVNPTKVRARTDAMRGYVSALRRIHRMCDRGMRAVLRLRGLVEDLFELEIDAIDLSIR